MGGCNENFEPLTDVFTTITGSVEISRGTVEVENVILESPGTIVP